LTLDVPDVAAGELAGALLAEAHQVAVFALSFLLVANIWWVHHRLFALLGELDSGLIAVNLATLGLVALVPFPTSLVGLHPNATGAVVPFIAVFLGITLLYLVSVMLARRIEAWRQPLPRGLFPWLVGGWVLNAAGMIAALLVALRWPVVGLAVLAASGPALAIVTARVAPRSYRHWAP